MLYDFDGNGQEAVSFGNKAEIVEAKSVNRIQPVHYGVNYHEEPLEFKLVFGSMEPIDRYDMEAMAFWLTGHQQYQWLVIDQPDLEDVMFRCLVTELKPVFSGWLPYAFEATFRCDCPYAYTRLFAQKYTIDGTANILFRNESSVRDYLRPHVLIVPDDGCTEFRIVNHNDGDREFAFTGLPASGLKILVDNRNGVMQELTDGTNLYGCFNLNFLRLVQGDNMLEVTGSGKLAIVGRFLRNVGA